MSSVATAIIVMLIFGGITVIVCTVRDCVEHFNAASKATEVMDIVVNIIVGAFVFMLVIAIACVTVVIPDLLE